MPRTNTLDHILRQTLEEAISQEVSPGLAAAVIKISADVQPKSFISTQGFLSSDKKRAVNAQSIYDLASLTKILNTTVLTACAVEQQLISVDEEAWPQWPGVRIGHILSHSSGLAAHKEFYKEIDYTAWGSPSAKKHIEQLVLASKPEAAPGARIVYSDLGFIALGALLEQRFGRPLDELFKSVVGEILPAGNIKFGPLRLKKEQQNCAPTQVSYFGGPTKIAKVDDENCYAMGGVAGHAGLFGSLSDLFAYAVSMAQQLLASEKKVFSILRDFTQIRPRPYGFDLATKEGSTAGALGTDAFGHLGFTGTSLWFDLNYQKQSANIYILLTNRVHNKSSAASLLQLRQRFHRHAAAWAA